YTNKAYFPGVKEKIIEMAMNGSEIRDTSRVLGISQDTVISELKKESEIQNVNHALLQELDSENVQVEIVQVNEAEMDEMWSFVKSKDNQRWLWHAIDHQTGDVLAYVFGERKDFVFRELKKLLEPFGIKHFYTDDWGAYQRKLPESQHTISKSNS